MQQLTVNHNLRPAEQLEQLADQVGGTYCTNVLVAVLSMGSYHVQVTLVNEGSPGGDQTWTMVNGSESAPASFATSGGEFMDHAGGTVYSTAAESYVTRLLEQAKWHGSSVPYYPE